MNSESKVIYKYPLEAKMGVQEIEIPASGYILSVHEQADAPCIYALVHPHEEKIKKKIFCFLTGQEIKGDTKRYIGTVLLFGGSYVLHIYE